MKMLIMGNLIVIHVLTGITNSFYLHIDEYWNTFLVQKCICLLHFVERGFNIPKSHETYP